MGKDFELTIGSCCYFFIDIINSSLENSILVTSKRALLLEGSIVGMTKDEFLIKHIDYSEGFHSFLIPREYVFSDIYIAFKKEKLVRKYYDKFDVMDIKMIYEKFIDYDLTIK